MQDSFEFYKGGSISEGNLSLDPLPKKGAKSLPWPTKFLILSIKENKQLTQKSTLARFIGNGTKVKLPSEIKPTLVSALGIYNFAGLKAIPCLSALLSSCILTYFSKSTEAGNI